MAWTFSIGPVKAEKGSKVKGLFPVGTRPDNSVIGMPIIMVYGAKPGATFCAVSTVHGDEYEGAEAIRAVWRELEPEKLCGIFVGVPILNVPAFETYTRCSLVDNLNLNRVFPGREGGFFTDRLAFYITKEILPKIDYLIDFHSGGNILSITPLCPFQVVSDADMAKREEEFALATGLDLLWALPGEWPTITSAAVALGKSAIGVEMGGDGRCVQEFVDRDAAVLRNLLRWLGMVEGEVMRAHTVTVVEGSFSPCVKGGLYRPTAKLRQEVKGGQEIGRIYDMFGDTVEVVQAPYDGIICSLRTVPCIRPGEWTHLTGKVTKTIRQ